MGQILIISNDRDTRTKLNGYLLAHIGHEVILQDSARNAISMMQLIPDVDLIITKDVILKENTAEKLFEFLILHNKDHGTNIPVVVLGDCPKGYPRSSDVPVKASWQVIVSEVASMLNMTPLVPIPAEEPVYYSLNIKYYLFLANMSLNFDSYMKVKNKNKEYEYELIIKADQKFERVNIEKLIKKGVQKLYVPKGSIAAAINLARTQLMKYVKSHHTDEKDRDQLNSDCYDLAADLVRTGEVDDFAYEFININLKAITLATSDVRAYENFLKKRKLLRLSYGYTHFYLTCLIMQEIIKNFKWATPDLKQKIIYLLYFHDISLNDDFIIQVHHSYLAKFHQIKPKERELVLSHALASSVISERFKDLYPDLPNLVREHHGVTAGNNILDTLSLIASPITMTLIVTEDYVTQFLEITEEPTKENYHAIFSFFEKNIQK